MFRLINPSAVPITGLSMGLKVPGTCACWSPPRPHPGLPLVSLVFPLVNCKLQGSHLTGVGVAIFSHRVQHQYVLVSLDPGSVCPEPADSIHRAPRHPVDLDWTVCILKVSPWSEAMRDSSCLHPGGDQGYPLCRRSLGDARPGNTARSAPWLRACWAGL